MNRIYDIDHPDFNILDLFPDEPDRIRIKKPVNTIIVHPKTKAQEKAIRAFLKGLDIPFEG